MMVPKLLSSAFFTAFVRPLSVAWPKKAGLVAFMPREGNRYIDNVAHFYEMLRLRELLPSEAYLLVTSRGKAIKTWNAKGRKVEIFSPSSPKSLLKYLRTELIVTDSWQWVNRNRIGCFAGAKKVQIWHGIPLKKIELSNLNGRSNGIARTLGDWVLGRYPHYDLVVSTSKFFLDNAFSKSFRAKRFANTGYPRNDYFFAPKGKKPDVDGDTLAIQVLETLKKEGKRVVVYAPTFRDTGGGPFEDSALNILELKRFAEENNLVFVVKLHPYVSLQPPEYLWPNVIAYDGFKDAAPLLSLADLLITDYSSIFFDYLLLKRPVVFFPYDYEKYFEVDRSFLFEYEEYTPGPKCRSQQELFSCILSELSLPKADFTKKREELLEKSFQHHDGRSSERLWAEILDLA